MDLEFATGILGALPELGGLSGLTVLVVILLRWQGQTSTRHGEELDRMAKVHKEETQGLRDENARLRGQRDDAEEKFRRLCALEASDNPMARARVPEGWTTARESTGPIPTVSPRGGRRRRDP